MIGPGQAATHHVPHRERFYRWMTCERHLVGAALLRIGLGAIVLYQLVAHWAAAELLWGPSGFYPHWLFARESPALGAPSFFGVESPAAFRALYAGAIGVALLYLAGWQTRWTGVWLYAAVWSLIKRNPLLVTGGDTLILVMLPFLLFLDTGAYLSADSGWRHPAEPAPPGSPVAALLHNVALGCLFVQLALFYGFAGIYKLLGERWIAGDAVYYTLRLPEFDRGGIGAQVYAWPALVVALTWATLVFELSAPLLLWSRRTRWLVTLQAFAFHGFIAVSMGLVVFSAQALVFQAALYDDGAYRRLLSRAVRRRSLTATGPPPSTRPIDGAGR